MSNEATVKLKLLLQNHITTPLQRAKEQLSGNVQEMKDKLNSLKVSHTKAFSSMQDEIPGLSSAMSLLSNPYALAAAAVVGLGVAYAKSVNMALDWEKGLAKVNVTAQLSQVELSKLSDKLLDIGMRNVAPLEQIPDAFNKIISAGLDVNTALQVLEPTLRAAKAGFTDVETTAAAAVGVMNSSGRDITTVYDVLFATLNKGNAEFADVARYLPKIIPIARGVGFSLEETAGAWAYFTAQGQSAEQATTGTMNMMKALGTSSTVKGLKSIGVNVLDASGKMKDLKTIGEDVAKSFSGLTDQQKMMKFEKSGITDMEAKSAILSITQDYKKFGETIDFVKNSQGQLNEAYRNSMTPTDHWIVLQNMLKGEMIKLGQLALPLINNIGEKILSVINYWRDLYNSSQILRDSLSALGTVIEWAFKLAILPIKGLWNAIKHVGVISNFVPSYFRNIKSPVVK